MSGPDGRANLGLGAGEGAGSVAPPDVTAHETAALTTAERTQGADPGLADAGAGQGAPSGVGRRRRRGRRGEPTMVPDAQFRSYYGRPVVKRAPWEPREIAGYFFLGGLAGASSLLAEGARRTGRPALERGAKIGAAAAIDLSFAALVKDLGRPGRFLNMLRVAKPTSPMSVGTWLLTGYAPLANASAAAVASRRLTRLGALAGALAAVAAPGVAAYTAVLVADTALPAWHGGRDELPFIFVASAAAAGGGLGMIVAPVEQAGPARRLATVGSLAEGVLTEVMRYRLDHVGEVYEQGRAGRLKNAAAVLSVGGGLFGATAGARSRIAAGLSGVALLAGSACGRFAIFFAGQQSADDPKYTVQPQRERRARPDRAVRSAGSG